MKIDEILNYLETLISRTDNKSELKVYKSFLCILSDLKNKKLSDDQLKILEDELGTLELNGDTDNRKKHIRKKREKLKKFLQEKFSLITEGYYTAIGMALGLCFGVAFGTSIFTNSSGPGIGLSIGMLIGLVIGKSMDNKAEKENRVIKITDCQKS